MAKRVIVDSMNGQLSSDMTDDQIMRILQSKSNMRMVDHFNQAIGADDGTKAVGSELYNLLHRIDNDNVVLPGRSRIKSSRMVKSALYAAPMPSVVTGKRVAIAFAVIFGVCIVVAVAVSVLSSVFNSVLS